MQMILSKTLNRQLADMKVFSAKPDYLHWHMYVLVQLRPFVSGRLHIQQQSRLREDWKGRHQQNAGIVKAVCI